MPTTSPDGIYYPDAATSAAFETALAQLAGSVQDAFDGSREDRQLQTFDWANSSERTSQAGMTEGAIGYQRDTDVYYTYTGTAWALLITQTDTFCVLGKSANQNLTTTPTAISWDVEIADASAMHDNVTNNSRVTVPSAGTYEVAVNCYNSNASGLGTIVGRLNGSTNIRGSRTRRTGDAGGATLTVVFSVALAANDYVEILASHATSTGTIVGGTDESSALLSVKRIGD